ncbi:MAG: GerAB/ArcD/ProY family transporter [Turicibacter sp.]|nr:GerAB/ArcD/ProY family transporter [Turicibacter sp.]
MKADSLNAGQLMKLTVFMIIGSTIVADSGDYVGADIWLVHLIGALIGGLFFAMHFRMISLQGFCTFPVALERCFGKWGGKILCLFYAIFFVLRTKTVGDTMTAMASDLLMTDAPLRLTMLIFLAAYTYGVVKGIGAIGKSAEIMFIIFLIAIIPFFSTSFIQGAFGINNLRPLFIESQQVFWHKVIITLPLPYTSLFLLVIFLFHSNPNERKKIPKWVAWGIALGALIIIGIFITNLAILGRTVVSSLKYPFYNAMMLAGIRGVLERLDPLAVVIVIICHYFKGVLYFYGAYLMLAVLLPKISRKRLALIMGVAFFLLGSGGITENQTFMYVIFPLRVMPVFEVAIPMAMWAITEAKLQMRKKKKGEAILIN